MLLKRTV